MNSTEEIPDSWRQEAAKLDGFFAGSLDPKEYTYQTPKNVGLLSMTELIVALDGPEGQLDLAIDLIDAGVSWFKIGPQMMCQADWPEFTLSAKVSPSHINVFLDLKLADTRETVRESVKRFADAGIAAVSTLSDDATLAASEVARTTNLKVWRILGLTDRLDGIIDTPEMGSQWGNIAREGDTKPNRRLALWGSCSSWSKDRHWR